MRDHWIRGLAANPAAPAELLLRLLNDDAAASWPVLCGTRTLPQPVIEAILAHHSPEAKQAFASNQLIDSSERIRLLSQANPKAPLWFLPRRKPGSPPLRDDAITALLAVEDPPLMTVHEWISELIEVYGGLVYHAAAQHPSPRVRAIACHLWERFDPATQNALTNDPQPEVRQALAEHMAYLAEEMSPNDIPERPCHALWHILGYRKLSREAIDQVVAKADRDELHTMARNASLPADVVDFFARHEDPYLREVAAERHDLTSTQLQLLMADSDQQVRNTIALNLLLTEAQRQVVSYHDEPESEVSYWPTPLWWVDVEISVRQATSVHPASRRRAARDSRLPDALAMRLAQDDDRQVRILVSLHHAAVAGERLLQSYLEYEGKDRARLAASPRFPTAGLAKFATHADPQVRLLACLDVDASPQLIDHLTRDAVLAVRQKAAACPRLPLMRVTHLLDDPELAQHAAANPALPEDVMWQLVKDYHLPAGIAI